MSESEVEEINQTEMKDYRNKEEAFPGHRWEPWVKEGDTTRVLKHTPVPYVEAINMDNRNQRWGYRYLYELYEPMMWFWRTAEWDLEEQKIRKKTKKGKTGRKIEEEEKVDENANWTPWIIILLDFFYTTGMPIDRKNDMRIKAVRRRKECEEKGTKYKKITEEVTSTREMNMKELEFYFIHASRQMWKILQMEESNETHTRNSFADLNLTSNYPGSDRFDGGKAEKRLGTSEMQGRLKVRAPEQVNLMMHKLAMKQMEIEEGEFALNIPMETWPEIGAVLWKERREMTFKPRLRKKTKPETLGLTLAELNDPITEIIDKNKAVELLSKFKNRGHSQIGRVRGQLKCSKCKERKEYTEYNDWAKIVQKAEQGVKDKRKRGIKEIAAGAHSRHCNKCWMESMEVNKVDKYKDGSIRIVPKEGGNSRWPKAEEEERNKKTKQNKVECEKFKRTCFVCREKKENTDYSEWAGACKEAEQGVKDTTITMIVKTGERRYCNECWGEIMKENVVIRRQNGDIRIIPKDKADDIRRKNIEGEE